MKRLLILFILSNLTCGIVFAASDNAGALREMDQSYKKQYNTCRNIAKNFDADSQFSGYLKNWCMLYDIDRQRVLGILFPMTTKNGSDYKASYKKQMAAYAVEMDKNHIEQAKQIVAQYCLNNKYKLEKRDPNACKRVNKLF